MVDKDEAAVGWVAETEARAETATPDLAKIAIAVHEVYAEPRATQKLIDDSSIDIEAWLSAKVAEKFARTEATAFVNGTGVGQPRGFLLGQLRLGIGQPLAQRLGRGFFRQPRRLGRVQLRIRPCRRRL